MSLIEKYPKEVEKILQKYPPEQKRSAVMPLLYLAQREEGYVDRHAMQDIAALVEMTETPEGEFSLKQIHGARGYESADPDTARIWEILRRLQGF